ncbi:hypothetical protein HMPREF0578_1867 [Mobiluncus mulieris 28-1]|nr:hypothetical protein HMPREF0578_1867 [Mobiluncus mulieris 28-1]
MPHLVLWEPPGFHMPTEALVFAAGGVDAGLTICVLSVYLF